MITQAPGARGAHACLIQYHAGADGPGAVRCGRHKLFFPANRSTAGRLYDLDADAGEHSPLPASTPGYAKVVANITAARDAHVQTLVRVVDQIALGSSLQYALCSDPASQQRCVCVGNCVLLGQGGASQQHMCAARCADAATPGAERATPNARRTHGPKRKAPDPYTVGCCGLGSRRCRTAP